jgi:hypothetical protein
MNRLENSFNFKNPDYLAIFDVRIKRLANIRQNPHILTSLKQYYKENPAQFITDWGCTFDPRNPEKNLPSVVPFILFEKQKEWINFIVEHWRNQKPSITEKSRDGGLSWLSIALACTLCLFYDDLAIGFGSRKESAVDKIGNPDSLLQKARMFLSLIPTEFLNGWDIKKDAPFMRIKFPKTNSIMTGECGDGIGRGGRSSMYFVDEAAFLERPKIVDASLSQTTNCRIDVSTPNGLANSFAEKRHSGKIDVFTFHWRDDPRKDESWYQKQIENLNNPIIIAQEIDIDYSASIEGVVIPSQWINSAIDAHIKLKIEPMGIKKGALDVADEGQDFNAVCGRHGILIEHLESWSGKDSDVGYTTEQAFAVCDRMGYKILDYDADGLGSGVRGFARIINSKRYNTTYMIAVNKFQGSASVYDPEQELVKGRKNKDLFYNLKAQAWWSLRIRFEKTHNYIKKGIVCDKDDIISISSKCPNYLQLISELSQPTYSINNAGKILIEKKPNGAKSPNLADAVMMCFVKTNQSISNQGMQNYLRSVGYGT